MTVTPGFYSHRAKGIPSPCAGSNRPYVKGSFRPALGQGQCGECRAFFKVNPTGRLARHAAGGGA